MDKSLRKNLKVWAAKTDPNQMPSLDVELTVSQQTALRIYRLLEDGQWWKTAAIAERLNKSPEQVRDVLQSIREPWKLRSRW
jgi:hypothetical protein